MARTALVLFTLLATFAEGADWPRWLGPHGDSSWRETGLIQTFPKEGPKVLWRVPAGHGYAGPAVAGDRVILADYVIREGTVDANPGARTTIQGDLRIRSLDAATGKEQWSHSRDQPLALSFPNGPRCTPTIDGDKVYYLGPEGLLVCLSLADGKPVWELDLKQTYSVPSPIWGFAAHPLIHGDLLYCLPGGPGTTAVALDKKTGKEVWRSLTAAEPGYAPPVIIQHGGVEQLIVWHPEAITSLHPLTGKQYWSVPFEPAYGMSIMAPRLAGDLLFIGAIQKKSMLLTLKGDQSTPDVLWRGNPKQALAPKNGTPVIDGDLMYGCDSEGELRCVEIRTGERLWSSVEAVGGKSENSGTFFMVKAGSQYVILNERGELILAELTRAGYREKGRHKILEATTPTMANRQVVWSHPAFALQSVFARNDKELIRVSLAQ